MSYVVYNLTISLDILSGSGDLLKFSDHLRWSSSQSDFWDNGIKQ